MKTVKLPKSGNRITTNGDAVPAAAIHIPKLRYRTLCITVEGKTALIVHAWSAKAVRMMLDKQMGIPSAGREKKNPLNDFKESLYYLPEDKGFGMPAPCFKAAIVTAANDVELKMTECKRNVHVNSYLVPINAPPLDKKDYTEWDTKYEKDLKFHHEHGARMRMDMVRLESGVADIRFRGEFLKWSCDLEIEFNEAIITAAQLTNLIQAAGQSGIGEWRPSSPNVRSGEFGRFTIRQQS